MLTDAALEGKRDKLVGLKENVIIGKLIPAATGLRHYRSLEIEPVEPAQRPEEDLLDEEELAAELGLAEDGDEVTELEGFGPSFAEELEELAQEIETGRRRGGRASARALVASDPGGVLLRFGAVRGPAELGSLALWRWRPTRRSTQAHGRSTVTEQHDRSWTQLAPDQWKPGSRGASLHGRVAPAVRCRGCARVGRGGLALSRAMAVGSLRRAAGHQSLSSRAGRSLGVYHRHGLSIGDADARSPTRGGLARIDHAHGSLSRAPRPCRSAARDPALASIALRARSLRSPSASWHRGGHRPQARTARSTDRRHIEPAHASSRARTCSTRTSSPPSSPHRRGPDERRSAELEVRLGAVVPPPPAGGRGSWPHGPSPSTSSGAEQPPRRRASTAGRTPPRAPGIRGRPTSASSSPGRARLPRSALHLINTISSTRSRARSRARSAAI